MAKTEGKQKPKTFLFPRPGIGGTVDFGEGVKVERKKDGYHIQVTGYASNPQPYPYWPACYERAMVCVRLIREHNGTQPQPLPSHWLVYCRVDGGEPERVGDSCQSETEARSRIVQTINLICKQRNAKLVGFSQSAICYVIDDRHSYEFTIDEK